jgi:hypothetical protein
MENTIEMVGNGPQKALNDYDQRQVRFEMEYDPIVMRPRRCWFLCLVMSVTAIAASFIGQLYMQPDEVAGNSHFGDEGVFGSDETAKHMKQALGHLGNERNSGHPGVLDQWMKGKGHILPSFRGNNKSALGFTEDHDRSGQPKHSDLNRTKSGGNSPEGVTSFDQGSTQQVFDELKWQRSTVSLDDGDMYEIVDQLLHDKNAFL